ncbi:MAG TPA: hypothetical protein VLS51_04870 [Propionibacteriaceae bacterium]|nr:hypothetical protein [Propionibacteriaceae bacterium]
MLLTRRAVAAGLAALTLAGCTGDWDLGGKKVLFLGNSFTDRNGGLDSMLASLAPRTHASRVSPGGSTLQQHAVGADDAKALRSTTWDVVVIQEQSQYPVVEPGLFAAGAEALVAKVRAAKATPVLLATWGRPDSPGVTSEALDVAYRSVANRLVVGVIPAGRAFAASLAAKPSLVLNQSDGHPTREGTYLAACTAFAAIYGVTPVGNSAHGGLSADVADHLQRTAARVTGR